MSVLNKVQAQSINDLDNYLMAKSIKSTISINPFAPEFEQTSHHQNSNAKDKKIESLTEEKAKDENGKTFQRAGPSTETKEKQSSEFVSTGTPIMDLLGEYRAMQGPPDEPKLDSVQMKLDFSQLDDSNEQTN